MKRKGSPVAAAAGWAGPKAIDEVMRLRATPRASQLAPSLLNERMGILLACAPAHHPAACAIPHRDGPTDHTVANCLGQGYLASVLLPSARQFDRFNGLSACRALATSSAAEADGQPSEASFASSASRKARSSCSRSSCAK